MSDPLTVADEPIQTPETAEQYSVQVPALRTLMPLGWESSSGRDVRLKTAV